MKTVRTFAFPITDDFSIPIPKGAEVLHVAYQGDTAQLWALVDPDAPPKNRRFRLAGTGHNINNPDRLTFVGSFLVRGGVLVFHLFEYKEPKA